MSGAGGFGDEDIDAQQSTDPWETGERGEQPHNGPNIEDKFWTARPELAHVRDFARARLCSPWALLGATLVRTVVAVPPFVVLPAIVGSHASLNLYVALVGPPGSGKDAAISASADATHWLSDESTTVSLGSGEGIAHAYMRGKRDGDVEQHTTAVLFLVSEIDTVAAIQKRIGSTLFSQLRQGWMGERLGFQYADSTRRLPVPQHKYRMGLIAGVQPMRAATLLNDSEGGTPQRFLWMPATDPDAPEQTPEAPEPLILKLPQWPTADFHTGRVVLNVCDTAVDTITVARLARLHGDDDALDAHAPLQQLKVAAALAILNHRVDVNDDDWQLAEIVLRKSDRVRGRVIAGLARVEVNQNVKRAETEADRKILIGNRVRDSDEQRVARLIRSKLNKHDGWMPHNELRRKIAARDRDVFDSAIDSLIDTREVEVGKTDSGTRYRARGDRR